MNNSQNQKHTIESIVVLNNDRVLDLINHKKDLIGLVLGKSQNWGIISIKGTLDDWLLSEKNKQKLSQIGATDFLSVCFQDITPYYYLKFKEEMDSRNGLLKRQQCEDIVNFINSVKNKIDTLIVNCDGGMARSGSVGFFATDYLGLSREELYKNSLQIISPVEYMLQNLYRTAWIEYNMNL